MKRKNIFAGVLVALLIGAGVMSSPAFAGQEYQENIADKAWDWATTLGKSGADKDQVLAQNKAERVKRYAEHEAKVAQQEAGKAGKDLKKNLGM